jgi:hypothetical protein
MSKFKLIDFGVSIDNMDDPHADSFPVSSGPLDVLTIVYVRLRSRETGTKH